MLGLGRRKSLPPAAVGAPFPLPPVHSQIAGTAGWAAIPFTLAPWQQIGAYAGGLLNGYPANIPGVQLHSGREWGSSHYYYPQISYLPNGSVQETAFPAQRPTAQRYGSTYTGPIGPVSAKQNAAAVTAAQIRQSGMQAYQWAKGLSN